MITMTYKDMRRSYFEAIDLHNAADRIVSHEFDCLYEGKSVVLFIDCYDLIDLLFPKDLLMSDNHHDWVRRIWTETFRSLDASDNLKISISPPTFLELFHFLERKARFVYGGLPSISPSDFNSRKSFDLNLMPHLEAYAMTRQLVNEASRSVPQLELLRQYMNEGKIVSANKIFDYAADRNRDLSIDSIVGKKFDSEGAVKFLRKNRSDARRRTHTHEPSTYSPELDFAINVDVSNIAQTIVVGDILEDTEVRLACHGTLLLLCCHPKYCWLDQTAQPPVINSWLALLLARALRHFKTKDGAGEYFSFVKIAAKNFLSAIVQLINSTPGLNDYVRQPETCSNLANTKVELPKRLETFYNNVFVEGCELCLPSPVEESESISVGPTGAEQNSRQRSRDRYREEVLEFAENEELRREKGEHMLEAARASIKKTNVLEPENVAQLYYPHGEVTTKLLLELEGYSFSDWE